MAGIVHAALYLTFAFNIGIRELVVSILVGTIATIAVVVFMVTSDAHFTPRLRDLMQAFRLPGQIISGTGQVLEGLRRQLFTPRGADSVLAAVPFDVGQLNNPVEAGRRALAITYTTAAPNFVVLGIVEQQQIMLYHQIVPTTVPTMTQKLGAHS
jgi:hypothetical protein